MFGRGDEGVVATCDAMRGMVEVAAKRNECRYGFQMIIESDE